MPVRNTVAVQALGEGDYHANFYRTSYALTHGTRIALRFKVDSGNTSAYLSLEANDATYRRFRVIAEGNSRVAMPAGKTWRFHHWIWRNAMPMDDDQECQSSPYTGSPSLLMTLASTMASPCGPQKTASPSFGIDHHK